MRIIPFFITLLFTNLLGIAQNKSALQADLILLNGRVWTGNEAPAFTEAVAISGNKILQTGTSAAMKKLAGKTTRVIDLKGKLVTAGITDYSRPLGTLNRLNFPRRHHLLMYPKVQVIFFL